MRSFHSRMIGYFLGIFSLPRVKEEFARYARAFLGEANRYSSGIKGEAIETRDSFIILARYIKREKITREEKKQFKRQVFEILRGIGIVVPPMLIPLPFVGTLILIIMDHLLLSMNIKILPSSFYPEKKEGLLTEEGIEKELFGRTRRNKPGSIKKIKRVSQKKKK